MQHEIIRRAPFVELNELHCPGCGDGVEDGRDGFGHRDGSQLCCADAGAAVEPVEVAR